MIERFNDEGRYLSEFASSFDMCCPSWRGYFVGWLPLASAWQLPLDDPKQPMFGLHRRRCIRSAT